RRHHGAAAAGTGTGSTRPARPATPRRWASARRRSTPGSPAPPPRTLPAAHVGSNPPDHRSAAHHPDPSSSATASRSPPTPPQNLAPDPTVASRNRPRPGSTHYPETPAPDRTGATAPHVTTRRNYGCPRPDS